MWIRARDMGVEIQPYVWLGHNISLNAASAIFQLHSLPAESDWKITRQMFLTV